jgi:pyruvate/2-oxoglutarate dehydrogenase complex dihydrolipoamide dehydrogenase (E3) component
LGESTVVIERRWIGGSCPNINCLPAKNEIWSAKVANLVQHAKEFGADASFSGVDMAMSENENVTWWKRWWAIDVEKYKSTGAKLMMGEARFTAPKTLEVSLHSGGSRQISGERVFLILGTASLPATPGLRECAPRTNIEVLELEGLPEHLIVIGGGYVGLELPKLSGALEAK